MPRRWPRPAPAAPAPAAAPAAPRAAAPPAPAPRAAAEAARGRPHADVPSPKPVSAGNRTIRRRSSATGEQPPACLHRSTVVVRTRPDHDWHFTAARGEAHGTTAPRVRRASGVRSQRAAEPPDRDVRGRGHRGPVRRCHGHLQQQHQHLELLQLQYVELLQLHLVELQQHKLNRGAVGSSGGAVVRER